MAALRDPFQNNNRFYSFGVNFPWGVRDNNTKEIHNCWWKRKKQLFNSTVDNKIVQENSQYGDGPVTFSASYRPSQLCRGLLLIVGDWN